MSSEVHPPCQVVDCKKESRYICPRCNFRYCSASCYGKHSEECVNAFRDEDLQALRGKQVSDVERRRFSAMLRRLRDDEECGPFLNSCNTNANVSSCDTVTKTYTEPNKVKSTLSTDINNVDEDADAALLLTQLMETLDNRGKDALFEVLHKSMENLENITHDRNDSGSGADNKVNVQNDAKKIKKRRRTKRSSKSTSSQFDQDEDNITDELEDLIEDMELTNMSYEDILQRLPLPLRSDFETRLREGQIQDLVKPWTPWWGAATVNHTVDDHDGAEQMQILPNLPTTADLKIPVSQARAIASQTLIFNVADVVASYCLALRFANGDWTIDASGAARDLWTTSAVLEDDVRHENLQEVYNSVRKRSRNESGYIALRDCADVFSGTSSAVARALFDAAKIVQAAAAEVEQDRSSRRRSKAILKGHHKLMFFVSWALAESTQNLLDLTRRLLSVLEIDAGNAEEIKVARQATQSITANR